MSELSILTTNEELDEIIKDIADTITLLDCFKDVSSIVIGYRLYDKLVEQDKWIVKDRKQPYLLGKPLSINFVEPYYVSIDIKLKY